MRYASSEINLKVTECQFKYVKVTACKKLHWLLT